MRLGFFAVLDGKPSRGRTVGDRYEELLGQIELAERLDFDSFWIAEHHFSDYGLCPSPAVLLAAAAQRTNRIRLGVAVSVLPLHNPLRVAEDYAMVDQLSAGRLNFGVGAGYLAHEFEGFGLRPEDRRERQAEAWDVIRRAWAGESTALDGAHYRTADVRLQVTPAQRPHPPVWWAMTRPDALPHLAARGYPPLWIPYVTSSSMSDVERTLRDTYREYAAAGHAETANDATVAIHAVAATDDASARALAAPAIERYMALQRAAPGSRARAFPDDVAIIGGPATVRAAVERLRAAGCGELLFIAAFGGLSDEAVRRSMETLRAALA